MGITALVFCYSQLKVKNRGNLLYRENDEKITITCSQMFRRVFDTIIVVSTATEE